MGRFATTLTTDWQNCYWKFGGLPTLADLLTGLEVLLPDLLNLLSENRKILGWHFLHSMAVYLVFLKYSQTKQTKTIE